MKPREDRPNWNDDLTAQAGAFNTLVGSYELSMSERGCKIPAAAGELSWASFGSDRRWRVMKGDKPLIEHNLSEKARFGVFDLEALADAVDEAMQDWVDAMQDKRNGVPEQERGLAT